MRPMIAEQIEIEGGEKGQEGWFVLGQADVSHGQPLHAPIEHALNIDFVYGALGVGDGVAVELTPEATRALAATFPAVLGEAQAGRYVE